MRTITIAILLALSSTPSHAGSHQEWASCTQYGDGSGGCSGTFAAFRNHSDPYAYVEFRDYLTFWKIFRAELNGVDVFCIASSSMQSQWPSAMASHGSFQVSWNSSGTCDWVVISNGSEF